MDLTPPPLGARIRAEVEEVLRRDVLPRHFDYVDATRHHGATPDWLTELRAQTKAAGLWNLGLPDLGPDDPGTRLSNLEYAPIAELLGSVQWASEAFNCQAPDVPNAAGLLPFVDDYQRERFLLPLLEGDVRSAFAMTEPAVASSDARNIATRIERAGQHLILTGRKWYISGASHPECDFLVTMGVSDPDAPPHRRHSLVLVPMDTPGLRIVRDNTFLGYSRDATELEFGEARVPVENLLGEQGGGFAMAQVRLGPARLHHCMRLVGACEAIIQLMRRRVEERTVFGKTLSEYDSAQHAIARCRVEVDQARLLLLEAAWLLDTIGTKGALQKLSICKVAVSEMALRVAERGVQIFGAKGLSDDTPIARWYAYARIFLIADGPTETHLRQISRLEPDPPFDLVPFLER